MWEYSRSRAGTAMSFWVAPMHEPRSSQPFGFATRLLRRYQRRRTLGSDIVREEPSGRASAT